MKSAFMITLLVIAFCVPDLNGYPDNKEWIAPSSAKDILNPLKGNTVATMEGKKLFTQICAVCHGDKGKGDGVGGATLNPKPRNFTLDKTQEQTDGDFFWKLSEGRPPMASYKTILTPTQRWQLINYIRTFKK